MSNLILSILLNLFLVYFVFCAVRWRKKTTAIVAFNALNTAQKNYIIKQCIDSFIVALVLIMVLVMLILVTMYDVLVSFGANGFPLFLFMLLYFLICKVQLLTSITLCIISLKQKKLGINPIKQDSSDLIKEFGE